MEWISIEDDLPPEKYQVFVRNGKNKCIAYLYRKKWFSDWDSEVFDEKIVQLHKVSHWAYHPICGLKIPAKDFEKFHKQAQIYRKQMKTRNFRTAPIIGLWMSQ